MSRRNIINTDYVHTIHTVIGQIGIPFHSKVDTVQNLAEEIEACRRKIWECVGSDEARQVAKSNLAPTATTKTTTDSSAQNSEMPGKSCQSPRKAGTNRLNVEFRVNAMKVVELQKELKSRSLDYRGRKQELRRRLLHAIFNDPGYQQNEMSATAAEPLKSVSSQTKVEDEKATENNSDVAELADDSKQAMDEKMVEAESTASNDKPSNPMTEPQNGMTAEARPTRVSYSSMQVESSSVVTSDIKPAEQSKDTKELPEQIPKAPSVVKAESEASATQSWTSSASNLPLKGMVKDAIKAIKAVGGTQKITTNPMNLESKSDVSSGKDGRLSNSDVSACSKISGVRVRELVSKISNNQNYNSSSSSNGSALSKSLQAKKQARLAKMAEIRSKSKPLANSKAATTPNISSLSLFTNTGGTAVAGKKKNLAAQMREKAAAAAALRKENISANQQHTLNTTGTGKRNLPVWNADAIPDALGGTIQQGFMKKAKVASPLDTYEISDREDSDTDDDSDSENENQKKPKKKIPDWALKSNLLPALEEQYNGCVDGRRMDPDNIFPEVQTCDLEAIFGGSKKAKYRSRTSSGNWTRDRVTAAEKLVYKRDMGF